jgi:hypothetical protein
VLELIQRCAGLFFVPAERSEGMQTIEDATATRLELKYCEGCGALHLRAEGSARIYCVSCWRVLREMASARRRERRKV